MLLRATKYIDIDEIVHVVWERDRRTMCGTSKIHWPRVSDAVPVDCEVCRNAYIVASLDEASADMGFVITSLAQAS